MVKQASNLHLTFQDYENIQETAEDNCTNNLVLTFFLKKIYFSSLLLKVGIGVPANIDGCCTKKVFSHLG